MWWTTSSTTPYRTRRALDAGGCAPTLCLIRDPVRQRPTPMRRNPHMAESVYKVIELVGTSTESWEKAAAAAVKRAAQTLRDLRVAEISQLDIQLKDGVVESYRAKVKVSFKYEG